MNKRLLRLLIMGGGVVFFAVAILTFIAYQRKPFNLPGTAVLTQEKKDDASARVDMTVSCFFFFRGQQSDAGRQSSTAG